ncbi:hypothetical protein GCM10010307_42890 [Streptomyces vastus]|uniref:Uncharacterized protein n=1 Tax=Streptomyces vastus TaxID=285451 RepID=A0ABN3R1Z7_9ACTN
MSDGVGEQLTRREDGVVELLRRQGQGGEVRGDGAAHSAGARRLGGDHGTQEAGRSTDRDGDDLTGPRPARFTDPVRA